MGPDTAVPEIRFAIAAMRQAANLARQVQAELASSALTKDDRSPVTVADFGVQALFGYFLEQEFPQDPLVAEEDSAPLRDPEAAETLEQVTAYVRRVLSSSSPDHVCAWIDRGGADPGQRFWVLDPIDGTKGFIRGDQYAIALALITDGEVQLGVLGCPNLSDAHRPDKQGPGSLVVAVRNGGAWHTPLDGDGDFEPLRVSDVSKPADIRLLRSFEAAHTNTGRIGRIIEEVGIRADPVRMDSQAKYAVLAAGKGDALLRLLSSKQPDYRERIWDQAAGSILVEEAGGRITDLSGAPLDFTAGRTLANNRGVCASNGQLHDTILDTLKRIT